MKAFITGITGQDGSYLAELLLDKGYEVHGMIRRSSSFNTKRIDHIFDRITLHYGDMTDGSSLLNLIAMIRPTEIYNLAQNKLRRALATLYGSRQISLQQFAATFRRGDLLEYLD